MNWVVKFKRNKITPARVAILGLLLSLMIALKFVFGFIMGIEVISFMFIFLGIFLPIFDLVLLISAFNFLVLALYGFGLWWLVYWIIWPIDAFISKFISKFTHNKFGFSLWGLVAGFSVLLWYFFSDVIFFGAQYAGLNIITALPVNLIEGFVTMIACITVMPVMAKVFNIYAPRFWGDKKRWEFKEIKNRALNITLTSLMVGVIITCVVLLFVYNDLFINLKMDLAVSSHKKGYI